MSAHRDRADFANVMLLEFSTTRDHVVTYDDGGWGTAPTRPFGPGWRIHDAHREHHTIFVRHRRWGFLP